MSKIPPKCFTLANKHKCIRGLPQPSNLDASEDEVHNEIKYCDVICSNPELAEYNPNDFDMCGKQVSTPNCTVLSLMPVQ